MGLRAACGGVSVDSLRGISAAMGLTQHSQECGLHSGVTFSSCSCADVTSELQVPCPASL